MQYTVMVDKGREVAVKDGVKLFKPYEVFSIDKLTPELQEDLKKGFIAKGVITPETGQRGKGKNKTIKRAIRKTKTVKE